ncbi:MAG: leucine-rich repeat protein [Treponema sp.]|nr:leucine-rich repeat protein [Treponema sp.]
MSRSIKKRYMINIDTIKTAGRVAVLFGTICLSGCPAIPIGAPVPTFEIQNGTLKKYNGTDETVIVPDMVNVIGEKAFLGNTTAKRIVLPSSLKKIGEDAFAHTRLSVITIPKSVTKIEGWAFFCSAVEKITFEADSALVAIPESFCQQCKALTEVTLPEKLESIGTQAFNECASLAAIQLPDSIHTIGNEAFRETALATVILPANVQVLGAKAFYKNEKLTAVKASHVSVQGDWKANLDDNGVQSYCFSNNPRLTEVELPDRVTHLKEGCLLGMAQLRKVVLPSSVADIGERVVAGSARLKVHIKQPDPSRIAVRGKTNKTNDSFFDRESGFSLVIPSGKGDAFKEASGWKEYKDYINEES